MERVGFVGLGIMGKPMALNLIRAGFPLTVYNRTPHKDEELLEAGAQRATSPAQVAENSDLIITIVGDAPDVKEVILGPQGIVHGGRADQVVIDMSTIAPATAREIGTALAQRQMEFVDAPVSGGEGGAIAGTLSIMVGGKDEVVQRCMPLFQAMGENIVHMGPIGAGQATKLVNQIVTSLNLLAVCEGLAFGAQAGLDLDKVLQVISGGAARSWALENIAPKIVAGDFSPGFMVKHQHKDLRVLLETASQLGMALPGSALVKQLFNTLVHECPEAGNQSLIKTLERLSRRAEPS
ncbi:MAG: NAD(P)-dependent oxidoreductase [Limnochordia bacterium]